MPGRRRLLAERWVVAEGQESALGLPSPHCRATGEEGVSAVLLTSFRIPFDFLFFLSVTGPCVDISILAVFKKQLSHSFIKIYHRLLCYFPMLPIMAFWFLLQF